MDVKLAADDGAPESGEVEFFGVKLKVRSARLAALLNSSVNDDVQVIGRRAIDAFGQSDDGRAEREHGRAGSDASRDARRAQDGGDAREAGWDA